jgi:AraC-like DNA-binding protein
MPRLQNTEDPMGLRVEQAGDLDSRRRADAWPAIVIPLDDSVITLDLGDADPAHVDRASFALVPATMRYRVTVVSPLCRLATLLLKPGSRARACDEYRGHVHAARFHDLLGTARILPRTRWVDELTQRYVFEREVCEKHTSAAAVFLETEIAKEIYFLCNEREQSKTRASVVHQDGDVAQRARSWVEKNLFDPLRVGDLARHCHTSESTLLRVFQREFHATPATYVRGRRLDAALLLLKSGRYTAGEVAARVGYKGLPAFTVAFQRRFGRSPSTVRHAEDALEVLPAHGSPPKRKRR